ncbi:olfactory receptor 14A16-like [Eublepharis macularius]|uniref:Olfactory receptor n=1 Tax=Eublepharis macularius TaxID=481883 RepID=A0AA97LC48_EUBMA|nr:olfactory receptor 14A16-like [Eublepharis macularius]
MYLLYAGRVDLASVTSGWVSYKEQAVANQTSVSEFLLLQFSEDRELQILHFVVFLVMYLATVTGNLLIITAVAFDRHLHTPMYLFLMNLAMQDLGQVTVIIPQMIMNSLMNTRHISFSGCVAQVLFFLFFSASDLSLLTVMAYDRYVAICNPLQYEMVMNRQTCIQMVASVWVTGLFYGVLHAGGTFASPFCSNVVNQFFCEIPQLLKLTCSDLYLIEINVVALSAVAGLGCFIFILVTYVYIFSTVLRMPSVQGRQKAFSTCLPHLTVVSIFLFTGCFAYLKPTSNIPSHLDVAFSMIYSMVPPMMNPLIYSMRSKEIQVSLSKLLGLRHTSKTIIFNILL